jgi:hypothetical protein
MVGGGVVFAILYNCVLTGNSAGAGGGAYGTDDPRAGSPSPCVLYNCTLTQNAAHFGGGALGCTLYNSIVYHNTAADGANYFTGLSGDYEVPTRLQNCCTTPLPTNGIGNITGPPLFMDMALGDFRLREDSPCIDAGTNLFGFTMTVTNDWGEVSIIAYSHVPTDILGNTRFIDGNFDGTVAWDIGAYEFNSFKPPRFKVQPQLTPEGWKLNIAGPVNKWFSLQRSSDLNNWEGVWAGWIGPEGVAQADDRDTGQKAMFYRVVVQ